MFIVLFPCSFVSGCQMFKVIITISSGGFGPFCTECLAASATFLAVINITVTVKLTPLCSQTKIEQLKNIIRIDILLLEIYFW